MYEIKVGDIMSLELGERKYRACITSPPYFGMRSYGDDDAEIGKGQTLDEYIEGLVIAFRKIRDSLTDDGTLWLNMGDCYNGSGGAGSDKTLLGVGWRLALALQADGWILRSEIIWNKSKAYPQPEAYIKRPQPRHETIFMLAKNQKYHYVPDNMFTVWDMSPVSKSGHEAPFPVELPMTCILASTDEGDWVLDPFAGSGTTAVAAQLTGRNSTMCELYADVADRMEKRLDKLPKGEGSEWL